MHYHLSFSLEYCSSSFLPRPACFLEAPSSKAANFYSVLGTLYINQEILGVLRESAVALHDMLG
jgi:hypothetical protein